MTTGHGREELVENTPLLRLWQTALGVGGMAPSRVLSGGELQSRGVAHHSSDGRSLFPCFTLPSPLHLCTKHRPAPKRLGQALFPGWWGRGVSSTAWLLLTSPPTPHPTSNTPQKYVQDILQEQLAESVYRALKEQGGHIYVCGDVTMAADVLKAIQRIMTQKGKLSVEDAGVFISRLRVS